MSDWRKALDELAEAGLLRRPVTVEGRQGPRVQVNGADYLCFCSNNYLGLAHHPALAEAAKAAVDEYGTGGGASSLTDRAKERVTELMAQDHERYLTDDQIAEMDELIREAESDLLGDTKASP